MIVPPAFSCVKLLDPALRKRVEGVPLPGPNAGMLEMWIALDGQTAGLSVANDKVVSIFTSLELCEAERARAQESLKPTFWSKFGL